MRRRAMRVGPESLGMGMSGGVNYSVFVRKSEEFFGPSRRIGRRASIQNEAANLSREQYPSLFPLRYTWLASLQESWRET